MQMLSPFGGCKRNNPGPVAGREGEIDTLGRAP